MVDPIPKAIEATFHKFGSNFKSIKQTPFFNSTPVRAAYLCPGTPFRYPFTCMLAVYDNYISVGAFSKFFDPLFDAEASEWFLDRNSGLDSRAIHVNSTLNGVFSCVWISKETTAVLTQKLFEVLLSICTDFEEVANHLDFSTRRVNPWLENCGLAPIPEELLRGLFVTSLWQDVLNVSGEVILKHKENSLGISIKAKLYLTRDQLEKATSFYSQKFGMSVNARNRSLSITHEAVNPLEVLEVLSTLHSQCLQTAGELEEQITNSTHDSTVMELSRIRSPDQPHESRNPVKELKLMRMKDTMNLFLRMQPQALIPFLYTRLDGQGDNTYLHFNAIRWYEVGKHNVTQEETRSEEETKSVFRWLLYLHSKGLEFQQIPYKFLHYISEQDLQGFKFVPPFSENEFSCFELKRSLTTPQEFSIQIRREIIMVNKFNQEKDMPQTLLEKLMYQFPFTDQIDFSQFTKQSLTECTELGKGGFGVIFLNEYRNSLKPADPSIEVALKVIKAEKLGKQSHIDSLMQEYKILRSTVHDNVIHVYGYTLYKDTIAIVMDYCSNKTLSKYMIQESEMPMFKRLKLLLGVANGMTALHSRNIAHLDLKPQNILVNGEGIPKISDFGLSKKVERGKGLEKTGYTLLYSAPEQLEGTGVTISGDIWAFGNLMYYVFFCKGPNDGLKAPGENIHSFSAKRSVVQSLKEKKIKPLIPDVMKGLNVSAIPHGFEQQYPKVVDLMRNCWQLATNARPDFKKIQRVLEKLCTKEERKFTSNPGQSLVPIQEIQNLRRGEESKEKTAHDSLRIPESPSVSDKLTSGFPQPQPTPKKTVTPEDVKMMMSSMESITRKPQSTPGSMIIDNPVQQGSTIKNILPGTSNQPIGGSSDIKPTPLGIPKPLRTQGSGEITEEREKKDGQGS